MSGCLLYIDGWFFIAGFRWSELQFRMMFQSILVQHDECYCRYIHKSLLTSVVFLWRIHIKLRLFSGELIWSWGLNYQAVVMQCKFSSTFSWLSTVHSEVLAFCLSNIFFFSIYYFKLKLFVVIAIKKIVLRNDLGLKKEFCWSPIVVIHESTKSTYFWCS